MPVFEREHFFKEVKEIFTDKKSGKIVIP